MAPRDGQLTADGERVEWGGGRFQISRWQIPPPLYVTYVIFFMLRDKCHPLSCSLIIYVAHLCPRERALVDVDGDHLDFQRLITLFHERRVETETSSGVSGGPRGNIRKSQGVLS